MAVLIFNGNDYIVDHAVKGADYIHGYDANGDRVVSIDGIADFSAISYNGEYLAPEDCMTEDCNNLKYCNGSIKTADGRSIPRSAFGGMSIDLAWENPNPSNTFAAQSVTLDMTDAIGAFINYKNQTDGSVHNTTGFIGIGDGFTMIYVPTVSSSTAVIRKGTVDENGVNFLETSNDDNKYHIPLKIYIVRG